ncbi:Rossmann-fold NAD(P)-binding domain-containing protein [Alkalibacillus flavidus]|uniref:hypothetical protein n=1 Tax=Alkalibacillus flavidus TaxID=546021 RepID=UPI00366FF341
MHDWSSSNYTLRIIAILLPTMCVIVSYLKRIKRKPFFSPNPKKLEKLGFVALCTLTLLQVINSSYLVKQSLTPTYLHEGVEISFPLKDGLFVVAQGGNHPLINRHFSDSYQKHALDLVKINKLGFRKNALKNLSDPSDYEIFDETLYSFFFCNMGLMYFQKGVLIIYFIISITAFDFI